MRQFQRNLAATALVMLAGSMSAAAQEPTGRLGDYSFTLHPVILETILTDDSDESAKFEEYRDFYDGVGLRSLQLTGVSSDLNQELNIRLKNVARADGNYLVEFSNSGRYNVSVEHNRIPHRFGNDARTLFSFTEDGVLSIADAVQRDNQAHLEAQHAADRTKINFGLLSTMIAPELEAGITVDTNLLRERTSVKFDYAKMKKFNLGVQLFHENRTGTRPYGASFGFSNITEVPEPIDYDTLNAEVAGEYNTKSLGLRAGFRHSSFNNAIDTLTYDNPFRFTDSTHASAYSAPGSGSIDGASRALNVLAPDSTANELFASGQVRIGSKSWASASASFTMMRQDDDLVAYTTNTAIEGIDEHTGGTFDATDAANLPVRNADNQVDVLNFVAAVGTKPFKDLNVELRLRRYDYDNKSEVVFFPGYARFDAVWEEIPRNTVPTDYTRMDAGLEATWTFAKRTNLTAGYTRQRWERELREVATSDEDVFKVGLNTRAIEGLTLRASYERGDRNADEYDPEAAEHSYTHNPDEPPGALPLQEGMRRFDEASRVYDDFRLSATVDLGRKASVSVGASGRFDEYQDEHGNEAEFGLITDEFLRYNAEFTYSPVDGKTFFVFADRVERDTFQRNRQSGGTASTNPIDDWSIAFDEANNTVGTGFNLVFGKLTADVTGAYSMSDGEADFTAQKGGAPLGGATGRDEATDFDNYEDTELTSLRATIDYQLTKNLGLGLLYRYEDYSIDSFILQGLTNYLPGALLLNGNNGNYTASVYAARVAVRF